MGEPLKKHDIFVSYAHVDDEPDEGADKGWVTIFVEALKKKLAQQLGLRNCSLWMDHELSRHTPFAGEILQTLHEIDILMVIVSPGYTASEWCRRERETFLKLVEQRRSPNSGLFIIERDYIEDQERLPEFDGLRGYRFWIEDHDGNLPRIRILGAPKPNPNDPKDRLYYDRLLDLARDVAKEIKRRRALAQQHGATPTPSRAFLTVKTSDEKPRDSRVHDHDSAAPVSIFLAEVTDDLEPRRDEVKRYFEQVGLQVLPDTLYSREVTTFREAADRDLTQCKLFVQLLGPLVGKKAPGCGQSYARLQYERARANGLPILQWRDPKLVVDTVEDPDQHALLEAETVQADSVEEFKNTVVARARYLPSLPSLPREKPLVFVNVDRGDFSLGDAVGEELLRYGIESELPPWDYAQEDFRQAFEERLQECQGLIIVYGNTPSRWVDDQLRLWRKIRPKRDPKNAIRALAIYEVPPPPPKAPPTVKVADKPLIKCRDGLKGKDFESFISLLLQSPPSVEGNA
jgi:hypothetical protein